MLVNAVNRCGYREAILTLASVSAVDSQMVGGGRGGSLPHSGVPIFLSLHSRDVVETPPPPPISSKRVQTLWVEEGKEFLLYLRPKIGHLSTFAKLIVYLGKLNDLGHPFKALNTLNWNLNFVFDISETKGWQPFL